MNIINHNHQNIKNDIKISSSDVLITFLVDNSSIHMDEVVDYDW